MKQFVIVLLSLALLWSWPGTADAQVDGTWGIGILADYDMPAFKLNNWFPSGGIKFGAVAVYVLNDQWTAEVAGHYTKYGGGELEKKSFTWSIDGRQHPSPQAKSEMEWATGAVNWIRHFKQGGSKLGQGGGAPYFVVGAGFSRYKNKVSGLIWPGQKTEPLDTSILMDPVTDRRVAIGANFGLGVEYFTSSSMSIDLRGQYSLILGSVRPLEAWGLEEAFPFQKLNVGVRFKFYFQE